MKEFIKKYKSSIYSLILFLALFIGYQYRQNQKKELEKNIKENLQGFAGKTMGTSYSIKYVGKDRKSLKKQVDSVLEDLSNSVSTYIPESEISEFNQTGRLIYRTMYFKKVLKEAARIFENTNGHFDPTVMPLVNAYGFGYEKKKDSINVDSLLKLVGFDKIQFNEDSVWTDIEHVQLDFSAIAKGYGVDVVARYLEDQNINNYMVEIGGEVRCKGKSVTDRSWIIGIENPRQQQDGKRIQEKVELNNESMATSGNYRNYYEENGKIYSHTINPKTGLTERNDLLSATVVTSNCMTADAYATAFMVMGFEKAKKLAEESSGLSVYLISNREDNNVYSSLK